MATPYLTLTWWSRKGYAAIGHTPKSKAVEKVGGKKTMVALRTWRGATRVLVLAVVAVVVVAVVVVVAG
jgi:hypothetical protein